MIWPYSASEVSALVGRIAAQRSLGEPRFLAKGSNNAVFAVGGAVIRVTGHWRQLNVRREDWCLRRAAQLGIPSPTPLEIGQEEELNFLIMSYVEGASGVDCPELSQEVWQSLGRFGALVNGIDPNEDIFGDPRQNWEDRVDGALDRLDSSGLGNLRPVLDWLKSMPTQFGLSHGDLDPRNIIVAPDETLYLIDWCCSQAGPLPHVDLYNILREHSPSGPEISAYLQGFGMSRSEFEAMLPEVRGFGLLENVVELVRVLRDRSDLVDETKARLNHYISRHQASWQSQALS